MNDEKSLTIVQPTAIQRHSMSDMQLMAKTMAASGLFSGVKTEQQAFALMLLCDAENIHPALALRRYHLINGTPAMKSETMLAEFKKLGGKVRWLQRDDRTVSATFHLGDEDSPPITWDDSRVKQAGLNNPNHAKFPCQMKTARVISEGVRLMAPGIVQGIYTPEEVMDFAPQQEEPRPRYVQSAIAQSAITVTAETTASSASATQPAQASPFPPTLFERARKAQLSAKSFTAILQEACPSPDAVDIDAVGEILRRCIERAAERPDSLPSITAFLAPFASAIHAAAPEFSEHLAQLGCPPASTPAPQAEDDNPFAPVEAAAPTQPQTLEAAVAGLVMAVANASPSDKLAVWNKHRLEILQLSGKLGQRITQDQTSRIAAARPS